MIIWNLDDILWPGTLAEGDTLYLSEFRTSVIQKSNKSGIANAICSKNDFEMTKAGLVDYGLWGGYVLFNL